MDSEEFRYEHFPVVCPTCQGEGHVFDEKDGLVTFVPVTDERLRPSWTKLKICGIVLFLLSLGGVVVFFIYPRADDLHIQGCTATNFSFAQKNPWFYFNVSVSLNNVNFYPVTFNSKLEMTFNRYLVGTLVTKPLRIDPISTYKSSMILKAVYETSGKKTGSGDLLRRACYKEKYYIGHSMKISSKLSYWMRSEQQNNYHYFYLDCSQLVFPTISTTTTKHPIPTKRPTETPSKRPTLTPYIQPP